MNVERLWAVLDDCSVQMRKGEEVEVKGAAVHLYAMPHESEVGEGEGDVWRKVDLHFVQVGVRQDKAEAHREELLNLLDEYPELERLKAGPSYIEVGAAVGDQGVALKLFAVGQVLGFWKVVIPATFGVTGEEADRMAGAGYVMISGFDAQKVRAAT